MPKLVFVDDEVAECAKVARGTITPMSKRHDARMMRCRLNGNPFIHVLLQIIRNTHYKTTKKPEKGDIQRKRTSLPKKTIPIPVGADKMVWISRTTTPETSRPLLIIGRLEHFLLPLLYKKQSA